MGEVRQVPSTGERALRVTAMAFALTVCALAYVDVAGAIGPTSFNMSPSSGPAGTSVSVSGSGCAPGLVLQPNNDFVRIAASTVPPTTRELSVASNGSWSGSFTIPGGSPAGPVAVTAVCVTDNFDSLVTIYLPKTFTVTGSVVPTTVTLPVPLPTLPTLPTLPGATPPGPTPTTHSSNPSDPSDPGSPGPGTSSPVSLPNDRIDDGTPGGGGGSGDIGDGISSSAGGGGAGGSATAGNASGKGGRNSGSDARAAELSSPDLAVSKGKGPSGLTWLLWLLGLSVPLGGAGFYVWTRYARRPHVPNPETDVS